MEGREHSYFPGYKITTGGVIQSPLGKFLKYSVSQNGDLCINIKDINGRLRHVRISKIVAELYVPKPDVAYSKVIYKDGNKSNVIYSNLKWVTKKDFYSTVKHKRGKLNEKKVKEIRQLLAAGCKHKIIAEKYGVTRVAVCLINTGKTWGGV